jgi:hypothetical protein
VIHLIWSGLGFLVAVITFGCCLASEFLVEAAFHDDRYYQSHGWPKLIAFVVAAAVVGVVGRHLRRRQGRVLIDPQTGSEVIVGREHTFFFIPAEYWPPILLMLGMIFLFVTD